MAEDELLPEYDFSRSRRNPCAAALVRDTVMVELASFTGAMMQPQALVDYELSVARQGYIVRALVKIAGKEPKGTRHAPLNLALVLDRPGSMDGAKLARGPGRKR